MSKTLSGHLPPFEIDQTGGALWFPQGWRRQGERRVTLSRAPINAKDLLKWVRFVKEEDFYHLATVDPAVTWPDFKDAIYNTWTLLCHVAKHRKWKDYPSRPEPDQHIAYLHGIEPEYSATFVHQHLIELIDYLSRKLASPPRSAATTSVVPSPPPASATAASQSAASIPNGIRPNEWERLKPFLIAISQLDSSPGRVAAKHITQKMGSGMDPGSGSVKGPLSLIRQVGLVTPRKDPRGYRLSEAGKKLISQMPPPPNQSQNNGTKV